MVRTIIVDDEMSARRLIGDIVKSQSDRFSVIAEAGNVKEALELIEKFSPDLVLLDIDLPDGNAFELLNQLGTITFKLVFITAYSEYALQAFKFSALDYVLKPIISEELISALNKAFKVIDTEEINLKLKNLLTNLNGQSANKKIILKSSDSIISVDIANIYFCESESGSYTKFHLSNDQKFLVSKPLKEYDLLLTGFNFFRVHKSYLVNMNMIAKYNRQDGGSIILKNLVEIPVSIRKKDQFLEKFLAL